MVWVGSYSTTLLVVLVAFILQGQEHGVDSFSVLPRQRQSRPSRHRFHSSFPSSSLSSSSLSSSLSPPTSPISLFSETDSTESALQRLVQYGLAWTTQPSTTPKMTMDGARRVPGCVATVYVKAFLSSDASSTATPSTVLDLGITSPSPPTITSPENKATVHIMGTADAIVSRGLLAVLAEFLKDKSLEDVLAMDPSTISQTLHLESFLSKGRNDGIANMLRVIQSQLRGEDDDKDKSEYQNHADEDDETTPQRNHDADHRTQPTVALLLSGGVDSSVALRLLQEDGYDVTAFYLKIWLEDELAHLGECPWEEDVAVCQKVCDQAGAPLRIMSLQEEYHRRVMEHTLNEAASGRTPNPDILCNSRVKFGCFLDSIDEKEFQFVASGHYAQIIRSDHDDESDSNNPNPTVKLVRAPDPIKDQSYFLCALGQNQLRRLLFPIGHLQKTQVRQLADHYELPNRHRPDSQGLCFLGKIKFSDFLNIHLGSKEGDIIDAFSGDKIGRHQGVWYHTVGQRKGIGKSLDPRATSRGPWYVVAKDPTQNIVYASNQYDEETFEQSRSEFHVENIHWIAGMEPISEDRKFQLSLKIRHGPTLVRGILQMTEDTGGIITLDRKDGGLAPGQYAVFYTDDAECIGGGIISERHWAKFLLETQNRSEPMMMNSVGQV